MPLKVRPALRVAHLWVGLVLSLLLLVLALSGSALVYKEAWWRLVHPELRAPATEPAPEARAAAIAAGAGHFPGEVRSVKMPEPGVGAYHLFLTEGEAFLHLETLEVLDRWTLRQRLMGLLFDVHAHLLAGERGEKVGGVLALLGAFLMVTGVYLWWPARRRTGLRTLFPDRLTRSKLIALHRDLGIYSTPILLILLLSGAGIVFYGAAGLLLNGLFGDPPQAVDPTPAQVAFPASGLADDAVLARVDAAFPGGARMVFYYPPEPAIPLHRFRVKQACELHPNGRSWVFADGRGEVIHAVDACGLPPGERALHALYPLHSAKMSSGLYKFATFLAGLALAVLSGSGVLAYARKLFGNGTRVSTDARSDLSPQPSAEGV